MNLTTLRNLTPTKKHFTMACILLLIAVIPIKSMGKMFQDHDYVSMKMPKGYFLTREELKELPRWCQIRWRSYGAMRAYVSSWADWERPPKKILLENEKWQKFFGDEMYNAAHHYIYALNWINRHKHYSILRYKGVENDLKIALNNVLEEFKYMHKYVPPKHKLYPTMLMGEAYAYEKLGNYATAVKLYRELMKRNYSYAPAYIGYANLLKTLNKNDEALKILQIGLKKTKGSKQIKQAIAAMNF